MDLSLTNISLRDFRNYKSFELESIGPLTVFVGPNAVGKTNIIEGIQLLTAQASFRHPTTEQLIREGANIARLAARASDGSRQLDLKVHVEEGKKQHYLNDKPKRVVDFKGILPSVSFTPDDLSLVKGPMSVRRAALDALGSQLSANHYLLRHDYEKVLRYKNRMLKDEASDSLLESINDTLITCGAQLSCYRAALFDKLAHTMSTYYNEMTKYREHVEACFIPSWESHDPVRVTSFLFNRDKARAFLATAIKERASEERQRHRALVGPHADHIEFFIDGKNASVYGSQGQQRSLVLSFKLAEMSLIKDLLHQNPVLLLDDVMSELDSERRRALVAFIAEDIQTFITTTNLSYFDDDLLSASQVVHLSREATGERVREQVL